MIQERAGSKTVSDVVTMDVLKKEKKYELWLEGCRWPDMVRWGDLEKAKLAGSDVPVLYDKLHRAVKAGENVIWSEDGRFYTISTHQAKDAGMDVGFKTGKNEYFPFPEISDRQNPKMNQLPGWASAAAAE